MTFDQSPEGNCTLPGRLRHGACPGGIRPPLQLRCRQLPSLRKSSLHFLLVNPGKPLRAASTHLPGFPFSLVWQYLKIAFKMAAFLPRIYNHHFRCGVVARTHSSESELFSIKSLHIFLYFASGSWALTTPSGNLINVLEVN